MFTIFDDIIDYHPNMAGVIAFISILAATCCMFLILWLIPNTIIAILAFALVWTTITYFIIRLFVVHDKYYTKEII